mmetsp:Transcript_8423/g.20934  ORF Transcript_8423/g.20934 Transcript_8423/m.20934 type:complete len:204 (+) Transcript_8423:811-1422(+)
MVGSPWIACVPPCLGEHSLVETLCIHTPHGIIPETDAACRRGGIKVRWRWAATARVCAGWHGPSIHCCIAHGPMGGVGAGAGRAASILVGTAPAVRPSPLPRKTPAGPTIGILSCPAAGAAAVPAVRCLWASITRNTLHAAPWAEVPAILCVRDIICRTALHAAGGAGIPGVLCIWGIICRNTLHAALGGEVPAILCVWRHTF